MGTGGYHGRLMRFSGVFDGHLWCCSDGGVGGMSMRSRETVGRWYETEPMNEKEPSACLGRKAVDR